jgi:RNA-directed DNA polymerase
MGAILEVKVLPLVGHSKRSEAQLWRELDEWLRHRLRAIQLKQWKRPGTIYRELKALGATEDAAKQVAGNCHRWWRNSRGAINSVLTVAYFDRLGLPRLS